MRPIRYVWITIAMAMVLTLALSSLSAAQVIVGGYPYPAYRYAARDSAVRFDVKPNETAVYLDGYYAGVVDDFDAWYPTAAHGAGRPRDHAVSRGVPHVHRAGLSVADNTFKMNHRMEKLPPGEVVRASTGAAAAAAVRSRDRRCGPGRSRCRGRPSGRRGGPPQLPAASAGSAAAAAGRSA